MSVKLEQLVNSYMIRYERLIPMIQKSLGKFSAATEINLYIDIYPILKSIYKQDVEISNSNSLSSCIFNVCGHYRDFFRSTCSVRSNIYIISSNNCPYINKQFYKNYNYIAETMFKSDTTKSDMIKFNLELMDLLSKYLYKIYFVPTTFEAGVLAYDLILRNKSKNNIPNIIISKDSYIQQLCATDESIVIFRPLKSDGKDNSYYINMDNMISTFLKQREVKTTTELLMPGTMTTIMALSSVKERNIKLLCNVSKAIKTLEKSILNYEMLNGYNSDIESVWNVLKDKINVSCTEFANRFKAIDIPYQHKIFYNTPECKTIDKYLVNLDDPKVLNGINAQYFEFNPLNFEKLCY